MRRLFFADKAPQTSTHSCCVPCSCAVAAAPANHVVPGAAQDCLHLRPFGTTQPVVGGLKHVLPKGQFVTCQLLWRWVCGVSHGVPTPSPPLFRVFAHVLRAPASYTAATTATRAGTDEACSDGGVANILVREVSQQAASSSQ